MPRSWASQVARSANGKQTIKWEEKVNESALIIVPKRLRAEEE
ncbi:hypothetical protein STZ1_10453 [Bacillus subtilis]